MSGERMTARRRIWIRATRARDGGCVHRRRRLTGGVGGLHRRNGDAERSQREDDDLDDLLARRAMGMVGRKRRKGELSARRNDETSCPRMTTVGGARCRTHGVEGELLDGLHCKRVAGGPGTWIVRAVSRESRKRTSSALPLPTLRPLRTHRSFVTRPPDPRPSTCVRPLIDGDTAA